MKPEQINIQKKKKGLETVPITEETPVPIEAFRGNAHYQTIDEIVSVLKKATQQSGGIDLFSEKERENNDRQLEDLRIQNPEAYRYAERVIAFSKLTQPEQQKIENALTEINMLKRAADIRNQRV